MLKAGVTSGVKVMYISGAHVPVRSAEVCLSSVSMQWCTV